MPISFGVNTWTWVSPFKTENARALFPKVREMGFDVVEIPLEDPSLVDARTVREVLTDYGLGATVCGAFGPTRDLTSEDPALVENCLQYVEEAVRFAETIGAPVVAGPIYSAVGKARHIPNEHRQREFDQAVQGLKQAGKIAGEHGVTLGIEPLNRFETDLVNTSRRALDMVLAVDSPNVRIHLDTFHMNIEEESVYEAVVLAGGNLCHVHASESNRGTPGMGLAEWEQLAEGLREIQYDGAVVIETFTPEVKEIARAAAIWRPLAPSQDQLAENGLAFLRDLLTDRYF